MAETWVHGHSLELETPDKTSQLWRAGGYAKVEGKPGSDNWIHFAISTPAGKRVERVMLIFTLDYDASLASASVWDGGNQIMPNRIAPDAQGTIADSTGVHNYWVWNVNSGPVSYGIGMSIQLKSGNVQTTQPDAYGHVWTPHTIAIVAAGCNLID